MDAAANVSGRIAADGAIGNCHLPRAKQSPRDSGNTARQIIAHRGADDRRGRNSFGGEGTNTAAVVVADITIDDRQAGWPGNRVTLIVDPVGVVADNAVSDCLQIPTLPFVMLRPEIVAVLRKATANTNDAWLPLIESWLAPGPEIVTFLVTPSPPLVSVMAPLTAKVILSPSCATASA